MTTVDETLKILNKNKRPLTKAQIADKLNKNAATVHGALVVLFNDGLVTAEVVESEGRGRPPFAYTITAKGRKHARKL